MRPAPSFPRGVSQLASCFVLIGLSANLGFGDEPQALGRIGRLFRFGGGGSASSQPAPGHNHDDPSMAKPINRMAPVTTPVATPATPPSTPDLTSNGPAPRITAQPRVSRPPTESDPIVTRVAIGRSDSGGQFGMFMQVFADGTILDSEGVHRVGGEVMKPLVDALHQGELYRLKGHCGAPSTDFIEQAHIVLYERSYGKLRATSFSYSGNPHGCDPSVRRLHAALEAIQMKLSSPTSASVSSPSLTSTTTELPPQQSERPVLSLTPTNP